MKTNDIELTIEEKKAVLQLVALRDRRNKERKDQVEFKKEMELWDDEMVERYFARTTTIIEHIAIDLKINIMTLI